MSSYSEGQTHQLMNRLETEGFSSAEVTKLGQYSNLAGFKAVLNGTAKIKPVGEDAACVVMINETTIAVNLGVSPKLPFNGAEVESHVGESWVVVAKRADGLYVDGRKVNLYLSKRQKSGKKKKGHGGHELLREELSGKLIINANVLDALLGNQHLIPEDWRRDERGNTRYIFFWATIYRDSNGNLCVRSLVFLGDGWYSNFHWLDDDWHVNRPAALRAS